MMVYLASPKTQQQAQAACDMPVLLSYAIYRPWIDRYQPSFRRVLIDSGAFSELGESESVDIVEYREWSERWREHADAIAGLDDISGDWHRSMKNYETVPWSFPTFHDSDPPELLPDLIAMAQERKSWLGIGLVPPRHGKREFIRRTLEQIPESIHIHGWALRAYRRFRRFDSMDTTSWWRDAMAVRQSLPWLTYGECLDICVKRFVREERMFEPVIEDDQCRLVLE